MTTQNNGHAASQQNGTDSAHMAVQIDKNISDSVMARIKVFEETGTLHLPKNYSAPNALRVAWLMLQDIKTSDKRPVLEVCTKQSIANALLRMILQGLNPAKRQGSFVAYGNQLTWQREYQGAIAIAKRHGVVEVNGCAVFKDDVFEYMIEPGTGKKVVTKHEQTIESVETGIVKAAYATKRYEDGRIVQEIMTMSQIRKAWEQGQAKGQSPAHKNFPDQMAIKTVISRILKPDINSSDDADLEIDDDLEMQKDPIVENVRHQIASEGNRAPISMEVGAEENDLHDDSTTRAIETETPSQNGPAF